jgi:hypothetical protein
MNADTFFETRLPWCEVVMRPPERLFFAAEVERATAPSAEPGPTDEDGVTEAIFRCYND